MLTLEDLPSHRLYPDATMTRRRVQYVSRSGSGRYHPARLRRIRGWTIVDDAGAIVWTEPHPITGRARPAFVATFRAALAACEDLAR